jgi:predicted ester cyclase
METEENKAIVRRWNEEIWKGNEAVFEEILAADCVIHWMGGPQELKATIARMRTIFSRISLKVEDQLATGDKVVTRWTLYGVQTRKLWGVPPTGKKVIYTGITINRLAKGKIVEEWCEGNLLSLMQQIGAFPC